MSKYALKLDRTRSEYEEIIREHIFSEVDRKIVSLHCLDGYTFGEISGAVNLSVPQVKARYYKALNRLF